MGKKRRNSLSYLQEIRNFHCHKKDNDIYTKLPYGDLWNFLTFDMSITISLLQVHNCSTNLPSHAYLQSKTCNGDFLGEETKSSSIKPLFA